MKLIAREEEKLGVLLLGLVILFSMIMVHNHNESFTYEFSLTGVFTSLSLVSGMLIYRFRKTTRAESRIMAPFFANIGFEMNKEEKKECRDLIDQLKNVSIEERIFWGSVFGIRMSNADETAGETAQYVITQKSLYALQTRKMDKAQECKILNELFGLCIYQYECIDYMSRYYGTKHLTGGEKKQRHRSPRTSDPCLRYNKIHKKCGMPRLVNTNLRKAANQ